MNNPYRKRFAAIRRRTCRHRKPDILGKRGREIGKGCPCKQERTPMNKSCRYTIFFFSLQPKTNSNSHETQNSRTTQYGCAKRRSLFTKCSSQSAAAGNTIGTGRDRTAGFFPAHRSGRRQSESSGTASNSVGKQNSKAGASGLYRREE